MPKAALRNAATSANPVAIRPSSGTPAANPTAPTTANTKPTSWANFSGGTGSRSVTGPSRGATRRCEDQAVRMLAGPAPRADREHHRLQAEDHGRAGIADGRHQQRRDDHDGGHPGGEPRSAHVHLVGGALLVLVDMQSCSCCVGWAGCEQADNGRSRARREDRRGYSAATTTTATTRDAAQIDCAALGEHRLKAGGHARQLTQ